MQNKDGAALALAPDSKEFKILRTYAESNLVQMLFKDIALSVADKGEMINEFNIGFGTAISRALSLSKKDRDYLKEREGFFMWDHNPNVNANIVALPRDGATWDDTTEDTPLLGGDTTRAVATRMEFFKNTTPVETDISHYFFNQGKMLPPMVNFTVKLRRNAPERYLNWHASLANGYPRAALKNLKLVIERVVLDQDVNTKKMGKISQAKILKYPVKRQITIERQLPLRSPIVNTTLLTDVTLPKRIALGFVRSESVNGASGIASTHFVNLHVRNITLSFDGKEYPQKGGYQIDGEVESATYNSNQKRAYWRAMEQWRGTPKMGANEEYALDYDSWSNYYNLYTFDLSPNKSGYKSQGYKQVQLSGQLHLKIHFAREPADHNYTLVGLCEYDSEVNIDVITSDVSYDWQYTVK